MSGTDDAEAYRAIVADVLRCIPHHDASPLSVAEIARRVGGDARALAQGEREAVVATLLVVLESVGTIANTGSGYRVRGPIPLYFLYSLVWYVNQNRPIIDNWLRSGVREHPPNEGLLDAPALLKLMEEKRLRVAGPRVEPKHRQRVAFVLVRICLDGRSYVLFEWDRPAEQYQLIGGHIEIGEEPITAATQEFVEELSIAGEQVLQPGRDFELVPDLEWSEPGPITWVGVSRTVAALTEYEVHVFGARLKAPQLKLSEHHRWLTIGELLEGRTVDGRRTGDPALFRHLNARLAGGLEAVPASVDPETARHFSAHIEVAAATPVFIGHGHSPEWRVLADHLRGHHGCRIISFESRSRAGRSITDILFEMSRQATFAVLIHTAEDEQRDGRLRARQNVIHETGLFQGRLGFDRAIVVRQDGCEDFSNLAGVQELHYRDDIREVFGDVVAAIRRAQR